MIAWGRRWFCALTLLAGCQSSSTNIAAGTGGAGVGGTGTDASSGSGGMGASGGTVATGGAAGSTGGATGGTGGAAGSTGGAAGSTGGAAGGTGGAAGGTGGAAGSDASMGGASGGTDAGPDAGDGTAIGTVGQPCAPTGAYGCAGHAQKGQLVCNGGTWQTNGTCAGSNNCDSTPGSNVGSCQPILSTCVGQQPGYVFCQGSDRLACGVDLVTTTVVESCAYVCKNAVCTGVCVPGAKQCSGNGVQTCSSEGQWSSAVGCPDASPSCVAGGCTQPPSCSGLSANCGPSNQSCCTSPLVTGGSFARSYDAVTALDATNPATVSDFRLDTFQITVGRFRKFVDAWNGGWRPAAGDGKHTHLNSGSGVAATGGSYEAGWSTAWAANLATTSSAWDTNLSCSGYQTWTSSPGANETLPINCASWYEQYAFCIWDGGFLPTEAEWNYAAAGGSEQRVFPWSTPPTSTTIDCAHANYFGANNDTDYCVAPGIGSANAVGAESPLGDGKYGQSDLSGNLLDWNLDGYAAYTTPCNDCAELSATSARALRGGAFGAYASEVRVVMRYSGSPGGHADATGARCARAP